MRRAVYLGTAVLALLLTSCATTYQPLGPTGGYSDYQTNQNQYYVYFNGNGYTSHDEVYQFFLTRAADIALNHHFKSFYVLQAQDASTTETYYTPGTARTTRYVDVYRTYVRSRYGDVGYLDTTVADRYVTVYTPPTAYTVDKPGFRGQVLLVNEPIKGQAQPFDAQTVYKDGMQLKSRIDQENRDMTMAGGAAALAVIAITILFD